MNTLDSDLLVIGGGINGAGIAADASGRKLSVTLCEMGDLASATSSWSTKLIHGGLRYLENYEFKLVKHALHEREVLMFKAPHLIQPLKFILPHEKHLRPSWMIRIGLFLYDHLATRVSLPSSKTENFKKVPEGKALRNDFKKGFSYYDCRTDDARLVVLNAMAAKQNGANILTRTKCVSLKRDNNLWSAVLENVKTGEQTNVLANAVVNAAGPWVADVLHNVAHIESNAAVKLVKGSHIVVPKLFEGDHAYILQNQDNRIVFAIPYQQHFTLIGTTDVNYTGDPSAVTISEEEKTYLCNIINRYFDKTIQPSDIVWAYAGVRPLYDDASNNLSKITREYRLEMDTKVDTLPLLSVFGGKLTTFRRLADDAMNRLEPYLNNTDASWTATAKLPGGDLGVDSFEAFFDALKARYAFMPDDLLQRLAESYGSLCHTILKDCDSMADLGTHFGAGLYQKEVDYLFRFEWAETAEDILWRRSKLGLQLQSDQDAIERLTQYIESIQ